MKKTAAVLLAIATAVSLSVNALALSRGQAMAEDNGYYDERITEATPGSTVYIALAEAKNKDFNYTIQSSMVPVTARVTSAKTPSFAEDKDYKLISTGNLDIEILEIEDGCAWYFAALKIKNIDISGYPEDGFSVEGTIKVTRKSGSTFTLDLSNALSAICYNEASDDTELKKEIQLYSYKSSTDFELAFPNGRGYFSGTTRGGIQVLAGMSHAKISAITKLNKNADMTFYLGNDAKFSNIRDGLITIEADRGSYLYKISSSNALTDITKTYDEDERAFLIETNVLGCYVVSDEKLSSSASSSSSDDYDYIYEEDSTDNDVDYTPIVITNPNTGAAA